MRKRRLKGCSIPRITPIFSSCTQHIPHNALQAHFLLTNTRFTSSGRCHLSRRCPLLGSMQLCLKLPVPSVLEFCPYEIGLPSQKMIAGSDSSDPHGCYNRPPSLRVVMLGACQSFWRDEKLV